MTYPKIQNQCIMYSALSLRILLLLHLPQHTDIAFCAGPERQLLWHAVQQQRLQGGSLPHGPAAGAVPHQGFRRWQDPHCHGHLPLPGSDEGSSHRPCPQVGSICLGCLLPMQCSQWPMCHPSLLTNKQKAETYVGCMAELTEFFAFCSTGDIDHTVCQQLYFSGKPNGSSCH